LGSESKDVAIKKAIAAKRQQLERGGAGSSITACCYVDSGWRSYRCVSVVYRIQILESKPAGYLNFFGFGLDWISFSFQPDPDCPNEIKCNHAKNLDME